MRTCVSACWSPSASTLTNTSRPPRPSERWRKDNMLGGVDAGELADQVGAFAFGRAACAPCAESVLHRRGSRRRG
jgi:hypothetical protein